MSLNGNFIEVSKVFNSALKVARTEQGRRQVIGLAVRIGLTDDPEHLKIAELLRKNGGPTVAADGFARSYFDFAISQRKELGGSYAAISHLTEKMLAHEARRNYFERSGEFGLAASVEVKLFGNTLRAETLRDLDFMASMPHGKMTYVRLLRLG